MQDARTFQIVPNAVMQSETGIRQTLGETDTCEIENHRAIMDRLETLRVSLRRDQVCQRCYIVRLRASH